MASENRSRRRRIVAPALFALVAAGCGGEAAPSEPELEVEAKQLVRAYRENEVAADYRYRGKFVRIKGKVSDISKGPFGGLVVTLAGPLLSFGDVECKFDDSHEAALAKLRPGDWIHVIGRVEGRFANAGSDVPVEDCRIEPRE
jgi:hypothetical protein